MLTASPKRRPTGKAPRSTFLVAMGYAAVLGSACGGDATSRDASSRPAATVSALSIRFEALSGSAPTASLTAFRAASVGVSGEAVLALVDPFTQRPLGATGCEIRDLDSAARALERGRSSVVLEEMPGVELEVPESTTVLRPAARLYPDLGTAIGGVTSETGPVEIAAIPAEATLVNRDLAREREGRRAELPIAVPEPPRIVGLGPVGSDGDFEVQFAGPAATMEFRPFGQTRSLTCAMPADGHLVIPAALIKQVLPSRLAPGTPAAVSIDAVRRDLRHAVVGSEPVLVSVEVRASVVREFAR